MNLTMQAGEKTVLKFLLMYYNNGWNNYGWNNLGDGTIGDGTMGMEQIMITGGMELG